MKQEIKTIDASFRKAIRLLESRGIPVLETISLNSNRYKLIKTKYYNYLVLYKRDFFNSFGKIFADLGEKGVGETINLEDLRFALANKVKFIWFVYPNGHIYSITIEDFLEKSHKRKVNFENKEVRSISLRHLTREDN